MTAAEHPEPLLRVVRGTPTPEEIAALVGVLLTRSRPAADPPAPSAWLTTARPGAVTPAGLPARPGPDEWRRSALPR
jgi:Acyl-CoA carboxylase epsilon subunit